MNNNKIYFYSYILSYIFFQNTNPQLYIKDQLTLMGDKEPAPNRNQGGGGSPPHHSAGIMTQVSPLQVLQSQLGLTPQQLQLLVHHQQLAFQSVSTSIL